MDNPISWDYLSTVPGPNEVFGPLAILYLVGGVLTLIGTNLVGRLADRLPRLPLFRILAGGAMVLAIVVSNLPPGPLWVATLVMGAFMVFAEIIAGSDGAAANRSQAGPERR